MTVVPLGFSARCSEGGRNPRRAALCAALALATGVLPGAQLVATPSAAEPAGPPMLPAGADTSERAGLARIRVVDVDGRPPERAIVRAIVSRNGVTFLTARGTTDAAGVATLTGLPAGPHWLLVDVPGRARVSVLRFVGADPVEIDVRLAPERRLAVEVRDELGRPVRGAEIEVRGTDPLPRGGRTNDGGNASMGGLSGGPYRVSARAPGYAEATDRASPEGRAVVRLVLRRLGALTVLVVDAAGNAAPGAIVSIAGGTLAVARTTASGGDGVARILSLPAGSYDLRAVRGMDVAPVEIGVALRRGDEATARLALRAGSTVRVSLLDDADRPVRGADVLAIESGVSPFPARATTDAAGIAKLGPFPAATPIVVRAHASGVVGPSASATTPAAGGEATIVMTLRRVAALLGDVRDRRGAPVDGASIEIVGTDLDGRPIDATQDSIAFQTALLARSSAAAPTLIPVGELGVVPGPTPPFPRLRPVFGSPFARAADLLDTNSGRGEPWVTRGDGSFRVGPVVPGRVRAIARHPAYVDGVSESARLEPGGEARVAVVLAAGGRITGRVRDEEGRPLAGAFVDVAARQGAFARVVRTDIAGEFTFSAVPSAIVLGVARPERPTEPVLRREVAVTEGGTTSLDLVAPSPRGASRFTVRDDRRYPIVGAQVTVASLDPASPVKSTGFSDARGEVEIPRVRGLRCQIEITAPGHPPLRETRDALAESVSIQLGRGVTVSGVVYAPGGRAPTHDAVVTLLADGFSRRTTTRADGTFSFADVPMGEAVVQVVAPGSAGVRRSLDLRPAGSRAEVDLGRLELFASGVVRGTVVDSSGRGVAGARVARDHAPTYVSASAKLEGVAVSDSAGDFELAGVPAGDVELEAYAADVGRGRSVRCRVDADRTTPGVKIVLRPSGADHSADSAPGGVAITLGEAGGSVVVVSVAPGSEAERAGVREGDLVVGVDEVPVSRTDDARRRLSGAVSTDVVVRVRRGSGEQLLRVPREAVRR